jgi:hypothetical protein
MSARRAWVAGLREKEQRRIVYDAGGHELDRSDVSAFADPANPVKHWLETRAV